jgi:hypothetical protein
MHPRGSAYIDTHTHIHTCLEAVHTYIHIQTYIHATASWNVIASEADYKKGRAYIHACMHACMHAHIHTHTHTGIHA